ncbi:type IV toxin-antitoxin system AbiEi family antitoxin [Daejeonella sp.]|uniref:type IV toxin-antitoxin system AbiEi family antitoxin n=1 Tax=Daejeonella sp. TaxID=2805397 RepID=UPI0030C4D98B
MEEQIIYKVIQLIQERAGLKGRWYARTGKKNIDGQLELKGDNNKYTFPVEFKKEVKPIHFLHFQKVREQAGDLIVIAETIYPTIREQLRKLGLNYLDAAGNCFIKKNDWLFLIDGFRTETINPIKKDRAFNKTGLILLFHFLNDENYLNATYRQMADDYGIALGNINYIINSLKDQGFVIQLDKKRFRLARKKELLDEWIAAFEEKLKPILKLGEFRFINGNEKEWEKIPLTNYETQWGGEPAAKLLTGYLKPGKLTLYTVENRVNLIKKYKLVPQEQAVLTVYKKFWKFNLNHEDTVPPILVYADLINTGDPRNIETARKLYDELLEDQF